MKTDYWNEAFDSADRENVGVAVQNVNPKPSAGSRNMFADDEPHIMNAAKVHGFKMVDPRTAKVISFVKAGE